MQLNAETRRAPGSSVVLLRLPYLALTSVFAFIVGVALSLVTQPNTYTDPDLSRRAPDAVHAALLADPDRSPAGTTGGLAPAALQLAALLRGRPSVLGGPETALLVHWLDTLATPGGSPVGTPPGG
jgi:hypothetical protein